MDETPDDFVFAVKASRYLTHVRRLREIEQGIHRFYERIMPLVESAKLGPVVWQFPANFRREGDALDRVATTLELVPPGRHCFEFRHESWFTEEVYALVRLHHGRRGRRGNYSESELDEWARRIADWVRRAEVFVYFNNDWEGFAVENARSLKRRLRPSPGDRAPAAAGATRASASSRSARRSRAA